MQFDLVGIGNPVYDSIITPWTRTAGRVLSGCSTNACLAAKRLGVKKVGLVGCIGADFEDRFQLEMNNYGIEASMNPSLETGGFHLIYDESGNRTLDVLGVAGKITPKSFPERFLNSKFFLIGPILGEVDLDLVEFIRASSKGRIFLDPQGLVRRMGGDGRIFHYCNKHDFERIAALTDFIKPNELESETITGEKQSVNALKQLITYGQATAIVTLAERGSLIAYQQGYLQIPSFGTRAIDPTGAGDVYAGSFITEYERTSNIVDAGLFASAASSIKVEQVGPDFLMSRDSVLSRQEQLRTLLVKRDTWY